jgi:hypothetical protein
MYYDLLSNRLESRESFGAARRKLSLASHELGYDVALDGLIVAREHG